MEWKKDRFLRMEANDDYYLGKPTIDEVIYVVYKNGDTMVQDLKSGALDAVYLFPPAQFDAAQGDRGHRGHRVHLVQLGLRRLQLLRGRVEGQSGAARQGVPHRPRVRASTAREIVEVAYGGHAWPGYTFLPPDNWSDPDYAWAPPEGEAHDFDPSAAKAMLDAAGYTDTDGDGVREYKGKPIKIRLWAPAESPESQRAGKLIAGWWKDVGVDVALSVQDEGVYFDKLWNYEGDTFVPDFDAYYWSGTATWIPARRSTAGRRPRSRAGTSTRGRTRSTTGSTSCRRQRWIRASGPSTSSRCRP